MSSIDEADWDYSISKTSTAFEFASDTLQVLSPNKYEQAFETKPFKVASLRRNIQQSSNFKVKIGVNYPLQTPSRNISAYEREEGKSYVNKITKQGSNKQPEKQNIVKTYDD